MNELNLYKYVLKAPLISAPTVCQVSLVFPVITVLPLFRLFPGQVPLVFPVITLLVSVYLVIAPLVEDPAVEYLVVAVSILAGLLLYFPFVRYKKKLGVIGE